MTKKEKDAALLNESIAHWRRLAKLYAAGNARGALLEGWHSDSCALCSEYYDKTTRTGRNCAGCPVSMKTRRNDCQASPWLYAARALGAVCSGATPYRAGKRAIAAQIRFLVSLRDERT